MLYVVQSGDTLASIAARFQSTIAAIMAANIICDPAAIFVGEPLIIPDPAVQLPKSGGNPYYVVHLGDTVDCLSRQFGRSPETLLKANQLTSPAPLAVGSGLLVGTNINDPDKLYDSWNLSERDCENLNSLWLFEVFYLGQFQWEALGDRAIPYLQRLMRHTCPDVRRNAVTALGRIATGENVRTALQQATTDTDPFVAEQAQLALKRAELVPHWSKRVHVTDKTRLFSSTAFEANPTELEAGTPIVVIRWHVPSPEGETVGPGALLILDLVQVLGTGHVGYLARAGYGAITFI